jgi:hypothetical protein
VTLAGEKLQESAEIREKNRAYIFNAGAITVPDGVKLGIDQPKFGGGQGAHGIEEKQRFNRMHTGRHLIP